jgi:pyruvate dehydrogenase E2 component (dihydrolipoamide acetyltransferase)
MSVNILMPALSPTMEKGNLAKWLKKEGDRVKPGDVIAEIETDKATMEYEAIDEGTLAKIVVPEGTQDVPVNQLIAVLAEEGEDIKTVSVPKSAPPEVSPVTTPPVAAPQSQAVASPQAQAARPPQPTQGPTAPLQAAGRDGHAEGDRTINRERGRIFSSPLARRLAKDAGFDLARIAGSGPHGRIVARDIESARSGRDVGRPSPAPVPSVTPTPQPAVDERIRALFQPGSYELVAHDNMRKVIARRLVEAKQTIPHFYLTVDCAIGKLLAARKEINAAAPKDKDGKPAYKISVNDFVIKALALALSRVPDANVTWTDAAMLKHQHSDIGVAVSIPGGLITPVVRQAETKSLAVISNEMKDFAARARVRKLKPDEYQGGTSAVSNLGMYGVKEFAAVINPPHATILAVGAGEERAVARNGRVEAEWMMSATLSTDHRAVDGALGAQLLGAFKALIENPVLMMV